MVRAGSLVRKNNKERGNQLYEQHINGVPLGRNNPAFQQEQDFSNSFIEGKSFNATNN